MDARRVAITGLGVVGPCGTGRDAFWQGLTGPAPDGERRVHDWDPAPFFSNPKEARRADRFTQFALAAAAEAVDQAGDLGVDPSRIGTLIGTGIGGIGTNEEQIVIQHVKGSRRVSPCEPMTSWTASSATCTTCDATALRSQASANSCAPVPRCVPSS